MTNYQRIPTKEGYYALTNLLGEREIIRVVRNKENKEQFTYQLFGSPIELTEKQFLELNLMGDWLLILTLKQ